MPFNLLIQLQIDLLHCLLPRIHIPHVTKQWYRFQRENRNILEPVVILGSPPVKPDYQGYQTQTDMVEIGTNAAKTQTKHFECNDEMQLNVFFVHKE